MAQDKKLEQEVDIDALLDGTLDDLADFPEFKAFPAGAHHAIITWRTLVGKDSPLKDKSPVIMLDIKGIETKELVDKENDAPISKDQETSVMHNMGNEFGQGDFKKIMAILSGHYGAASNRILMEKSQKAEVLIVTSVREQKDKSRKFTAVENLEVL